MRDAPSPAPAAGRRQRFTRSDTGQAAGLATASLANNVIQLVFTLGVTRILGKDGYGALAALVAAFLILLVAGQSLQAAAGREVAFERLGDAGQLHRNVHHWIRTLLAAAALAALAGAVLRHPLAAAVGTPEHPWAAAAIPLTGVMWLLVCVQRGVLQGLHAYRAVGVSIVGEATVRLGLGLPLAAAAGVTGAFAATAVCFAIVAAWLSRAIGGALGTAGPAPATVPLRDLVRTGLVPIGGLILLAVLQNVDVILARHRLPHDQAGSYAVAAVAAKTVVWVAIGVGLQVLPQAAARALRGEDPRPVLYRALAVVGVIAVPALAVFAAIPRVVLRVAFGPDTTDAAPALALLGAAMTLLAVTYLTVQFMIALHVVRFLWVLAIAGTAEIAVLATGSFSITGFALTVVVAQASAAVLMVVLALRARAPAMR